MTPPPQRSRNVTPFPQTIPPPLPPDEQAAKKVTAWRAITAAIFAFAAVCVGVGVWQAGLNTKEDAARDRTSAAAERFSMRLEHQALRERVLTVEILFQNIDKRIERIDAQLTNIARATGARPVPPVTQPEGATP